MRQLALLVILPLGILLQSAHAQCSNDTRPLIPDWQFPKTFFDCRRAEQGVGSCVVEGDMNRACTAVCLQQASDCITSQCAALCPVADSPLLKACSDCANQYCAPALQSCTSNAYSTFTCQGDFFCEQEYWVFPVVIAAASLGGVLLIVTIACLCCCRASCCCNNTSSHKELENAVIVQRQQMDNNTSSSNNNNNRDTYDLYKKRNVLSMNNRNPRVDLEDQFGMGTAEFEATNPVFSQQMEQQSGGLVSEAGNRASLVLKKAVTAVRTSLTNKPRTADSNVRVSKLPEGFRQSIQVGLTPDMIFDMDTANAMKKANNANPRASTAALPARVIQSHKFAKMMGVEENDLNKPFSEPVTERVERMARVANSQGISVGGSTANLGPQIANQFTIRQQARLERQRAVAEEERIRAEIRQQNLAEKEATKAHNSYKHSSMKKTEAAAAAPPVNKLKQFLEQN